MMDGTVDQVSFDARQLCSRKYVWSGFKLGKMGDLCFGGTCDEQRAKIDRISATSPMICILEERMCLRG